MKNTRKTKCLVSAFCVMALLWGGIAWGAPSEKQLKAMGIFLSNFTELGLMNVSTEEMTRPESYPDLVRFGVWHNYINNFKSRIENVPEKAREKGDLRIEAKWVEESVLKYFGLKIEANKSVDQSDPPYLYEEGYFYFWGADGEAAWYARIEEASNPEKGLWELSGEIYNADDPQEILGDFRATVKEAQWNAKQTYVLVRMSTEFR